MRCMILEYVCVCVREVCEARVLGVPPLAICVTHGTIVVSGSVLVLPRRNFPSFSSSSHPAHPVHPTTPVVHPGSRTGSPGDGSKTAGPTRSWGKGEGRP